MSARINPASKFLLLIIAFVFFLSIALDYGFARKSLGLSWYANSQGVTYSTLFISSNDKFEIPQADLFINALLIEGETYDLTKQFETDMNRILSSRPTLNSWKLINELLASAFTQSSGIQLMMHDGRVIDTEYFIGMQPTVKFTLLVFFASVVFVMCAYLYSFTPRSITVQLLMFSAACFAVFTVLEAVMPIGEIAPLSTELLYLVLIIRNWCFLSFVGMIAVYPKKLVNPKIILWWSLAQPLLLYVDLYTDFSVAISNQINAVYGFMIVPLLIMQWKKSRLNVEDRLAMKTIVVSYIAPTFIFMLLYLVSTFLIHIPYFQQTTISLLYFSVCACMLWMAYKNRILDIEQYWFKPWAWVLSGALLMVAVLCIANTTSLSYFSACFVALTLFVGAILPIKRKIGSSQKCKDIEHSFPKIMQLLDAEGELDGKWEEILVTSFSPLKVTRSPQVVVKNQLLQEGHVMLVCSPMMGENGYCIAGKHKGESLFSNQDVEFIDAVSQVFRSKVRHPKANATELSSSSSEENSDVSEFEVEIARVIDCNIYNEQLSPKFLANSMALSLRALQLKTKKEMNCSPREMITKRKMERAASLLTERTDHINQIAYELCYENPAYFTRQFKACHGVTPREYRQRNIDEVSGEHRARDGINNPEMEL